MYWGGQSVGLNFGIMFNLYFRFVSFEISLTIHIIFVRVFETEYVSRWFCVQVGDAKSGSPIWFNILLNDDI